ncbi:MAG: TerD family protein [Sphingomonas sp.]
MQNIVMGGNAPLSADRIDVVVEWPASAGTLDSSTYLVTASGKVRSDADMIFYNQRSDASGSVKITQLDASRTCLAIDLTRVPDDISRIVTCVTIEDAGRTMAAFQGTAATILVDGEPVLGFRPDLTNAPEVAMRLIELYRRNGAWKFRADGQGFNDGLAPLARSFGIDVAEDEQAPPREADPVQQPAAQAPAQARPIELVRELASPPAPPAARRDDGTVKLTAALQGAIWSGSPSPDFGEISARLMWSSQCGGLQGRPRPLELGLGCFYELQDGRKGVVQSWDSKGQFDAPPYVHLEHVESAGTRGEQKLRINGAKWPTIRKLTLFAYLQSGAPSWHTASLSLTLSTPGEAPVSIDVEEGTDGSGIVALVSLEQRSGEIVFTRLARFAIGHQELDQDLGWDLRWKTRYP